MKEHRQEKPKTRMIHVRIPEDLHKRIRVRTAEQDTTIQDWVAMLIRNELDHPKVKNDNTLIDKEDSVGKEI
jgi:predicted HicB family RNase H-like nuclease